MNTTTSLAAKPAPSVKFARFATSRLHRTSGAILGVFLLAHLANNLLLLAGPAVHMAAMDALRTVYRWPPVEALLLACVAIQVTTGAARLHAGWKSGARMATPARLSAMVLLYFLMAHTGAVLGARGWLALDTNLYFAAAGLHVWPFGLYFTPHYVLAVTALCVHLACALAPRLGARGRTRQIAIGAACATGAVIGIVLVSAMAAETVQIPPAYTAVFHTLLSR